MRLLVYLDEPVHKETLMAVKNCVGLSISVVQEMAGSGLPLFNEALFKTRHEEIAAVIRKLLPMLREAGASHRIYLYPQGAKPNPSKPEERFRETPKYVFNFLDDFDEEMERTLEREC